MKVSSDDLLLAALWLDNNEGDPEEREPMQRVAQWLRAEAETRTVRNVARQFGIPMKHARRAIEVAQAREGSRQ